MTAQDEAGAYRSFRERLDAVLRTKDPERVRAFLIERGQWSEADQGDSAFAMWMMIAGSPSLAPLHPEAEQWLREHGHADEAQIITGGRKRPSAGQQRPSAGQQRPSAGQQRPGSPRPQRPPQGQRGQAHRNGGPHGHGHGHGRSGEQSQRDGPRHRG